MRETAADECRNKAKCCIDNASRARIRGEAKAWRRWLAADWIKLADDFDRLDQARPRWTN